MYLAQLLNFLRGLLAELEGQKPPDPVKPPVDPVPLLSRVRLRLLRAQYNRTLHPEQYTDNNPDGLYSGKDRAAIERGIAALNRESNAWYDLTAYDANGVELSREQLKRAGLAFRTSFGINEGFIIGDGADERGNPKDWQKENPAGANISEHVWRSSLGYTVRVHHSDEGSFTIEGAVDGVSGEPLTIHVS